MDLEYENSKQLQVTTIKITESKESKSIQRLDVSGSTDPGGQRPPFAPLLAMALGVPILSGPCTKFTLNFIWTNTEEIKQDISIVKLNISNLHKAVIPRATWNLFVLYEQKGRNDNTFFAPLNCSMICASLGIL